MKSKFALFNKKRHVVNIEVDGEPIAVYLRPVTPELLTRYTSQAPEIFSKLSGMDEDTIRNADPETQAAALEFSRILMVCGVAYIEDQHGETATLHLDAKDGMTPEDLEENVSLEGGTLEAYRNGRVILEKIKEISNLFRTQ